jgi:pimeloyl-ACP methyl ester carboxylesterase
VDQEDLLDPGQLADPDSLFCEFNGVQLHHKICHHGEQSELDTSDKEIKKVGLPMVLLHGFGASVFSWEKVMRPLASLTGSKVLAFDRPAFGLTSRVREFMGLNVNPYSTAFSVLATISFIDMLGSDKAILMGYV